jgi:hypothetical protein
VLDLSSNHLSSAMGGGLSEQSWPDLALALVSHQHLTHLDLSHNGLAREECVLFGDAMKKNTRILGKSQSWDDSPYPTPFLG